MKFTLKLGIYYIVLEMMVNTEQIRFGQKRRVKTRRSASESSACPFMPRGNSFDGDTILESDSPTCPTLELERR